MTAYSPHRRTHFNGSAAHLEWLGEFEAEVTLSGPVYIEAGGAEFESVISAKIRPRIIRNLSGDSRSGNCEGVLDPE